MTVSRPEGETERLRLASELFALLDAAEVRYVHWKSNEHLGPALAGETDLDLLVDPQDRQALTEVTGALGFIPMRLPESSMFPGREGLLGLDETRGSLLHLDVQDRLFVGERVIKNLHLPVEDWLLSDRLDLMGVKVPRPEKEMILLYVRMLMKTAPRQWVRSVIKGGSPVPPSILRELTWLADRVQPDLLAGAVKASELPLSEDEVHELRRRVEDGSIDWRYLRSRRRSVLRRLRPYRRQSAGSVAVRRLALRLRRSALGRVLGLTRPGKVMVGRAPLVALVGADGSGKTRLSRDLDAWLGWKLDVRHVYFGQPKGGLVWRLVNKPGSVLRHRGDGDDPSGLLPRLVRYTDAVKWVVLSRRRHRMAVEAVDRCAAGEIVIAERYPLAEFRSMETPMDGPRLQGGDGAPRALAQLEDRHYSAIHDPDLLIVLDTDVDTLRARKIDLTLEEHLGKVAAVGALEPGPGRVIIDAARPYEQVLLEAKKEIWAVLRAAR